MSTSLGDMVVTFGADLGGLSAGIGVAKNLLSSFSGGAGTLVGGLGVALASVGGLSLKMAGDFQTSMTQLVTGAGESQKNLGLVSSGILSMAGQVGESTKELSAGMYLIESSGQHGAQALTTLKDAAEGAKVGAASLADVANGVTTEMTDYAASHLTAAAATNTLIAAVSEGKTHMADLATAMSTILPTSSAMHVSLNDTAGALATMTGEGTNAAAAATYLRQLLSALENPASKAAAALKSVGLTSAEVSGEMQKSLPDTLQMITDALGKKFPVGSAAYVAALSAIAGGTRQMQGILELTGSHIDVFKNNVLGIADAVKKGGDSILGWSLVQQDFNQKMDEARASVEALMISVGTKLLPVATQIVGTITPAITAFTGWVTSSDGLARSFSSLQSAITPVWNVFVSPLFQTAKTGLQDFLTIISSSAFLDFAKILSTDVAGALSRVAFFVSGVLMPPFSELQGWMTHIIPSVEAFFTAMSGGLTHLSQFADAFGSSFSEKLTSVSTITQSVTANLSGSLAPALSVLSKGVQQISGFFDALNAPTIIVNSTLSSVATTTLPVLNTHMSDTVKHIMDLNSSIQDTSPHLSAIQQRLVDINSSMQNTPPVAQTLQEKFTSMATQIGSQAAGMANNVIASFAGIAASATDFIHGVIERLGPIWAEFVAGFELSLKGLELAWQVLGPVVSGIWAGIVTATKIGADLTEGAIYSLLDLIGGQWQKAWQDFAAGPINAWHDIESAFGVNPGGASTPGSGGGGSTYSTWPGPGSGGGSMHPSVTVNNHIYMDSQEMTQQIMTRATQQIRLANGGRR